MFCKKKATLLVAIVCVFAVSFVACSKKDAASSGADGATSQEVTKADKKAEAKKAKESKKGSSKVKLPTTPNAEEDFIVQLTEDGTGAIVTGYKGKSGGVYIPATIQGLPVKEVKFSVESEEFVLVNALVIPDGCTRVTIEDSRSESSVVAENQKGETGWYTLSYSLSKGDFEYEKIDTNLGTEILGITLLSLPDSVTECSGLENTYITEFEVPASVQVFAGQLPSTLEKVSFRGAPREISAIFGNTKITEIVIPEGVKELYGFANCETLKTITLPDSIEMLGSGTFENCTALEVANLPANLKYIMQTYIEGKCFKNCSSLKELKIPESLTQIRFVNSITFNSRGEPIEYDFATSGNHFAGCSSLPLATQARLKQLGYEGSF